MKHTSWISSVSSAVVAAVLLATSAVAQQQQTMTFDNAGTVTDYGYYIGTYQAMWQTAPGSPMLLDIWCVDFNHRVKLGQTYNAYFTNLAGADLSRTRFGGAMKTEYAMAAWLSMQFSATPTVDWGGIQAAMWYVMTPSGGYTSQMLADAKPWITQAKQGIQQPGFDLSQFTVISDVNQSTGSVQEFIARDVTVTPEPSTVVLMSTGLLVLFVAYRRRRTQA